MTVDGDFDYLCLQDLQCREYEGAALEWIQLLNACMYFVRVLISHFSANGVKVFVSLEFICSKSLFIS